MILVGYTYLDALSLISTYFDVSILIKTSEIFAESPSGLLNDTTFVKCGVVPLALNDPNLDIKLHLVLFVEIIVCDFVDIGTEHLISICGEKLCD